MNVHPIIYVSAPWIEFIGGLACIALGGLALIIGIAGMYAGAHAWIARARAAKS